MNYYVWLESPADLQLLIDDERIDSHYFNDADCYNYPDGMVIEDNMLGMWVHDKDATISIEAFFSRLDKNTIEYEILKNILA